MRRFVVVDKRAHIPKSNHEPSKKGRSRKVSLIPISRVAGPQISIPLSRLLHQAVVKFTLQLPTHRKVTTLAGHRQKGAFSWIRRQMERYRIHSVSTGKALIRREVKLLEYNFLDDIGKSFLGSVNEKFDSDLFFVDFLLFQ